MADIVVKKLYQGKRLLASTEIPLLIWKRGAKDVASALGGGSCARMLGAYDRRVEAIREL